MSGSHDTHHVTEEKPVAFTVPLILACVLILIIGLFLSLCDPKPHGHHAEAAEHGMHDATATEATHHHDAAAPADHQQSTGAVEPNSDSMSVETTEPAAETPHEAHH